MLFGKRQSENQPGESWDRVNGLSEPQMSCTCGMQDMPGQHTLYGCIPRKGHPWLSRGVITEEDSEASAEEGETSHYYEIMSSVMERNTRHSAMEDMKRGGGDVVDSANSATSQTLGAPEPPTQDDATPTETPVAVAGLPSVYLMMPRQAEQATHLREAKEIRRSLLAWSRQAIAICSIILVAGVVLTMLAVTLIAKDNCKAVKEI